MKVTFDSNVWERVVHPDVFPVPEERHSQLAVIHNALKSKQIKGFICQSVATLEGVKRRDRASFMTTQTMRPKILENFGPGFRPVVFAPDQSNRPPLMPVLEDRLKDAIQLGMKILEVPIYTEMELPMDYMESMTSEYIRKFGSAEYAISSRGVGRAFIKKVGRELAMREGGTYVHSVGALPNVKDITTEENSRIVKAVAEAADGDAVAAHIAYECDVLVTLDFGISAGKESIFDRENRQWLKDAYGVQFSTIADLSAKLLGKQSANS